jgi:HEPN domain-containing protein
MLIEYERDMATRFLEFLEEIIEWLREGDFHDLLETE